MKKNLLKKICFTAMLTILLFRIGAQIPDFEYFDNCSGMRTKFVSTSTYPNGIGYYQWNFGDGVESTMQVQPIIYYQYSLPGTYEVVLKIFDLSGIFINQIAKNVAIASPPIADFFPVAACFGTATEFINQSNYGTAETIHYYWSFGDGEGDLVENPKHIYQKDGYFPVTLVIETESCSDTIVHWSHVFPLPDATILPSDEQICAGESVTLSVNIYNESTLVLWSVNENNTLPSITISPDSSSWYAVTMYEIHYSDTLICEKSGEFYITVYQPPVISIELDTSSYPGQNFLVVHSDQPIIQYIWMPADGLTNPYGSETFANPQSNIIYTVQATNDHGCYSRASVSIGSGLSVNNIITPNNDGKNDEWVVGDISMSTQFEVYIYNRWGEEVFNQTGVEIRWNGKFEGEVLPEGAYYYLVKHVGKSYTGAITLIK